jgi:nucleotide-binding universal stress UspA family protein
MKLLIGVDGSGGSFAAVRFVSQLLSPADKVFLLYSPPPIHFDSESPIESGLAERARQAVSNVVFDEAKQRMPEALRGSVTTIVGSTEPRQGLIDSAHEHEVDLLVVGATGTGFVTGLLLGSVGRATIYTAPCPVLVVRPRPADREAHPLRVLFADDGSPAARRAGEALRQFTWPSNVEGTIIRVVESLFAGQVPDWLMKKARSRDADAMAQAWAREHDEELAKATGELSQFEAQLPSLFHGRKPLVVEGPPTQKIMEAIAERQIDLVAIGSRGQGMVQRWLMGSTSEHVFTYAPCSVLIAREKES